MISEDGSGTEDVISNLVVPSEVRFAEYNGIKVVGFRVIPSYSDVDVMEILFDYGNGDVDTLRLTGVERLLSRNVNELEHSSDVLFNGAGIRTLDFANSDIGDLLWERNTNSNKESGVYEVLSDVVFEEPYIIELVKQ
ncbi:MAG: hypothetical protein RIC80_00380 [Cyclobacteriaceae bacterium]